MSTTFNSCLRFVWAGLLHQVQTGGIVPSQRFLIAKMLAPLPRSHRGPVIELGAGTGALTVRLAQRCPRARVLAYEINPVLARDNQARLQEAGCDERVELIVDSAAHLLAGMRQRDIHETDFVLSGIPLGNLSRAETRSLIEVIRKALAPGGLFIQFQHFLLDRRTIREVFPKLRTVPVWFNFPPAFVYYAQG